jgi:plastocyanin
LVWNYVRGLAGQIREVVQLRLRARRLPALVTATLVLGLLAVPGTVRAGQQTLSIRAGAAIRNGAPAEGVRFYSPELNVHTGDTLTFENRGFHTATLLPGDVTDVDAWIQENQGGLDAPFAVLQPDPDDTDLDKGASPEKPAMKFNNNVGFPIPPDCGGEEQPPCDFQGDTLLSSGVLTFTEWSSTINSSPGNSYWVLCLIHPNMRLKVNVVDDTATATTQDEIDSYRKTQLAEDAAAALAKHNQLKNKHVKKNGAWQAWAGYDGEGYALIAMYPKRLEIRKGAKVQWNFNLIHEIHTVTFPKKKALKIFNNDFLPWCDPDGDAGAGPDTPPELEGPPFCNDPTQLELDISSKTVFPYGDGSFGGSDFETSGIRGPVVGTDPYTLKFTKKSGPRGFKYMCMIHGPFQDGTVQVGR